MNWPRQLTKLSKTKQLSVSAKGGSQSAFKWHLIRRFVAGATARTAADLLGVIRHTKTLYFHKLRELISSKLAEKEPWLSAEVEVDESYFGGSRKGKRGRGAAGKVSVFRLLKRGGKVDVVIIPNTK